MPAATARARIITSIETRTFFPLPGVFSASGAAAASPEISMPTELSPEAFSPISSISSSAASRMKLSSFSSGSR